jgi:ion channel
VTAHRHRRNPQGTDRPVRRGRLVLRVVLRSVLSVVVLVVLYFVLPMNQPLDRKASGLLASGLVVVTLLAMWHLRAIVTSDHPGLRAVEALSTTIPLFLLVFASAYFLMNGAYAGAFSQPLTRLDALYFTITVFSTVGFGDITPTTETTRVATMLQMLIDLLVVGLLARSILSAVRMAQDKHATQGRSTGSQRSQTEEPP